MQPSKSPQRHITKVKVAFASNYEEFIENWPFLWHFQMTRVKRQRNIRGTRLFADNWVDADGHNLPVLETTNKTEWEMCSNCFWAPQKRRADIYLLYQIGQVCRVHPQSSPSLHNCQKPLEVENNNKTTAGVVECNILKLHYVLTVGTYSEGNLLVV